MNFESEWKIANRLYFSEEGKQRTSRPAVRVALGGIVIGVMVMIIAICLVVGFKQEVRQKGSSVLDRRIYMAGRGNWCVSQSAWAARIKHTN